MPTTLRSDLLPSLCTYLPEIDAHWIQSRDPADFLTHMEAYTCVRRSAVSVPAQLVRDFANGLIGYLDGTIEKIAAD